LLLWSDGQRVEQLGLSQVKMGTQALYGLAALAGAFAVHLLVSAVLAVGVQAVHTDALSNEAEQRSGAIGELLSTSNVPAFLALMLFAAAFEEIAFRGFVLPRLRHATGSWLVALLLMSFLFGLGHLYEGPLAVLQTAALGIFFGLVLMWRGHLLPAVVAHVGFNGTMISVALWLRHTGAL
jgi:membrane protease YdiL (CAAX protease family)